MKYVVLIVALSLCSLITKAQTKPAANAPKPAISASVKKPTTPAPAKSTFALKNAADSVSYAIGILDGNFFKTQGLTNISPNALSQGFNDVIKGNTIFTPEQADQIVRNELQKNARKKIQPAINEGLKFLAENKKRPGVKETATGLQYEVMTMGTGAKPADTSVVKIHYEGFLLNGTYFDGSRKRGEPLVYPLNKLIPGWVEGVQLMPIGSRFKFYIPYQLGYGEQGSGETIPGGSTLIFDVELLDIVKSNQ
jgi:FKBP-type peptidyl-prolyl cis-trans isomerase